MGARRRLCAAAAIAALGALAPATGAQACSCVRQSPVQALRTADAAVVASLIDVVPRGRLRADFRYRIRRVYRGARSLRRGEVISVRSALRVAACGLPRRRERPVGLFLARDERGRWSGGICGTISPRRLWWAARRAGGSAAHAAGVQQSCAS